MARKLLLFAAAACLLVYTCLAQTEQSSSAQDQNAAVQASPENNAPVAPQEAVPGTRDGKDEAGRPVQPVGTAETQAPTPVPTVEQQEFAQNVKDVYFDFNQSQLRAEDRATLLQDAEWLKSHANLIFTIAGQADPRGNVVYNLFLSDQRALATRDALVRMGVSPRQIVLAEGWGKIYPVCQQDDESCWRQDRRAHLEAWSPKAGPLTTAGRTTTGEE